MKLDRWENRRKMAWLSMIGGLLFPLLVLFTSSEQVSGIAASFYAFVGMVVGAYIGFATWDDNNFKNKLQQTMDDGIERKET